MIGNNTIELNQATMRIAVQHYFDTVLFAEGKAPQVENIEYQSRNCTFEVHTKERKQSAAIVPPSQA